MTSTTFVAINSASTEQLLTRVNTALSATVISEFLLGTVSPFLNARARDRFRSEGDEASGHWVPLSERTQDVRSWGIANLGWAIGPDHPINKRTGELEDYITRGDGTTIPWQQGSSLIYPDPSRATGKIKEKMKTAQMGRSKPNTPARPVLAVNDTDMTFVINRLLDHVVVGPGGRTV